MSREKIANFLTAERKVTPLTAFSLLITAGFIAGSLQIVGPRHTDTYALTTPPPNQQAMLAQAAGATDTKYDSPAPENCTEAIKAALGKQQGPEVTSTDKGQNGTVDACFGAVLAFPALKPPSQNPADYVCVGRSGKVTITADSSIGKTVPARSVPKGTCSVQVCQPYMGAYGNIVPNCSDPKQLGAGQGTGAPPAMPAGATPAPAPSAPAPSGSGTATPVPDEILKATNGQTPEGATTVTPTGEKTYELKDGVFVEVKDGQTRVVDDNTGNIANLKANETVAQALERMGRGESDVNVSGNPITTRSDVGAILNGGDIASLRDGAATNPFLNGTYKDLPADSPAYAGNSPDGLTPPTSTFSPGAASNPYLNGEYTSNGGQVNDSNSLTPPPGGAVSPGAVSNPWLNGSIPADTTSINKPDSLTPQPALDPGVRDLRGWSPGAASNPYLNGTINPKSDAVIDPNSLTPPPPTGAASNPYLNGTRKPDSSTAADPNAITPAFNPAAPPTTCMSEVCVAARKQLDDRSKVPAPVVVPPPPSGPGSGPGGGGSTSGGGSGMGGLSSFLNGLMKGLTGAPTPSPQQPAQACKTDSQQYAQQQQQYNQQLQQYNSQLQQYNYQQQQNMQYGYSSYGSMPPQPPQPCSQGGGGAGSGGQCQPLAAQPNPATCPIGTWRQMTTSLPTGQVCPVWQCVAATSTTPTAQLTCEPGVVEDGTRVTISYTCGNSKTSTGYGFVTGGATSGATSTIITPPVNAAGINFALKCENGNLSSGAQCSVQIAKVSISMRVVPEKPRIGESALIGWITTGMESCTVSSPDQPEFTDRNSSIKKTSGIATSSPLTERTDFYLNCTTVTGGSREEKITVDPYLAGTVTSSIESRTNVVRGSAATIQWNFPNAPDVSAVALWLYNVEDKRTVALITGHRAKAGSYTWNIPSADDACNTSSSLVCGSDLILGRTYTIIASLYTPPNASLGEFNDPSLPEPEFLDNPSTNSFKFSQ